MNENNVGLNSNKELEQEKSILEDINNLLETKITDVNKKNQKLKKQVYKTQRTLNESEQEKIISKEIAEIASKKSNNIHKRFYIVAAMAVIISVGVIGPYSIYVDSNEINYLVDDSIKSGYVIQNLKGDTIDTWLSWRITDDKVMRINILNADEFPQKVEIIKNVILSTEVVEIDNSLQHKGPQGTTSFYYVGWAGALDAAAQKPTQLVIPSNLDVIQSPNGAGDITIKLSKERHGDGYTGFTKSIADESENQILKSNITIFDVESLTDIQLQTIIRHELGHALGLAHSTAPEDLMSPSIQTDFPYISPCNVDAIATLYDGGKTSQVVCDI